MILVACHFIGNIKEKIPINDFLLKFEVFKREYTDDCVFNETLEQHNYNTYSSAKWSTARKTLYLGLNRRGQPRRVQAKGHNLGRLSAYARVLTQVAPLDRVEALQRRLLGAQHNVRHRHNSHRGDLIQQSLCPSLPVQEKDGRDKFRCRKRKKRKKRKRRCRPGEKPGPQCQTTDENATGATVPARNEGLASNGTRLETKRSCEGAASDEACRREALSVPSKKRKLRVEQAKEEEREGGGGGGGGGGGEGRVRQSRPEGGSKEKEYQGPRETETDIDRGSRGGGMCWQHESKWEEKKEEGASSGGEEELDGAPRSEEVHAWRSGHHVCGADDNYRRVDHLRNVLFLLVVSWNDLSGFFSKLKDKTAHAENSLPSTKKSSQCKIH
ncbi:hypothetical protein WN51_12012 [Melipona quadrifasciata]|uniref:Uncharacterized protein n=1 Tax=Melipona quadrifasciata TaxID=166423 RepID=A0A0M9A212_9HYME|nr:hypothetical protein WN51_12012 [Melipona quadrifasciata]